MVRDQPDSFNVDRPEDQAAELFRRCRAGDIASLSWLKSTLPVLRSEDISRLSPIVQVAEVHHALAVDYGFPSWAALGQCEDHLSRLLIPLRAGYPEALRRNLGKFVSLAEASVHAACALGNSRALTEHLKGRPTRATELYQGWSPLVYTCASPLARHSARHEASLVSCAQLLLDHGADPNGVTGDNTGSEVADDTTIYRAMMSGNVGLVMLLRKRDASDPTLAALKSPVSSPSPSIRDLNRAMSEYFQRPAVRERMANAGRFSGHAGTEAPSDGLQRFRMPNFVGAEPHLWAAATDRVGQMMDLSGGRSRFAQHVIVTYAPVDLVELLLERDAIVDSLDDDGQSVVVAAVRAGNFPVADVLRSRGFDDDSTPLDRLLGSCLAGHADQAQQLSLESPGWPGELTRRDTDVLVRAAGRGDLGQVRLMLDAGFPVDGFNEAGATALHQSSWHGQVEVVHLLLSRGATVGLRDELYGEEARDWARHGAVHLSGAKDRCLELAKLLDKG